jgi:hypothetical protein
MPYALTLTLTLAACFTAQTLALRASGGRTTKSESNFFSSVARIQTGQQGTPEILLLGSSLTGRLPDRSGGFAGVANLGIDGGSAADTLRAIDRGLIGCPPHLIVEGNTLYRAVGQEPGEVARAIGSRWFEVGRDLPNFGATARPSAFLYSWLMERKHGAADEGSRVGLPLSTRPRIPGQDEAPALDDAEEKLVAELSGIVQRLVGEGCRITMVMLPPGAAADSPNRRIPQAIASRAGVMWWDLNEGLPAGTVRFTDGVHLSPASASATMTSLLEFCDP